MKTRKYCCPDCGKEKSINIEKNNYEKYVAKYPRCHPCGAKYAEDKLKGTWFKKEEAPWNKGLNINDERVKLYTDKGSITKKGKRYSISTEFKYVNGNGYRHLFNKGLLPKKCSVCGEYKKVLHVHHIDKDRTNNNINNFKVLCRKHHLELHGRQIRKKF